MKITSVLILLLVTQVSYCYKAVMLIPGIGLSSQYWPTELQIMLEHRGTDVVLATYDQGVASGGNMWAQVHGAYNHKSVQTFLAKHRDEGFHMVAGSQGTLVARGLIEYYGLPVIDFISIHGAHMGVIAYPPMIRNFLQILHLGWLVDVMTNVTFKICFTSPFAKLAQKFVGVCGFGRDECMYQEYLKYSNFLAYMNNEIEHENSTRFKENFSRIRKLYLFSSPDDGVINPWQSSHFGSLACNGTLIEMRDQKVYKDDAFGLKTLDSRGAINNTVLPDVSHFASAQPTYMQKYIIPLLT